MRRGEKESEGVGGRERSRGRERKTGRERRGRKMGKSRWGKIDGGDAGRQMMRDEVVGRRKAGRAGRERRIATLEKPM